MSVIYIKEQGAYVSKRGERMLVEKNKKVLLDMPVANVENITLIGNVQMSTQMLVYLMQQGIDVHYFSFAGKYLGHTAAEHSRNIFLRLSQYEQYQDQTKRLQQARLIVSNKIDNQIALLEQVRWTGNDYDWHDAVKRLRENQAKLEIQVTGNQIMGIEGVCSNIYFHSLGHVFKCNFTFSGRNRRPPRDPINVILSLGYTFLTKEVSSALEGESFEMYLGFLHGIRYGRKSLALDMVEEFRQPVVDRLTLRLFNKNMLGHLDFEEEEDMVSLNEDGFRTFCREFERWMTDKTFSDGDVCFRFRIKQQAALLKKSLQNRELYHPYAWYRHSESFEDKKEDVKAGTGVVSNVSDLL